METGRVGWSALALQGMVLSAASAAAEKTVAEEILDVLRAQGAIAEQQYESWSERAQEERAAWVGAEPEAEQGAGERKKPLVTWDKGIRFHPTDEIELNLGGRVYADYAYFDADDDTVAFFDNQNLDGGSGVEFSRARIRVEGKYSDVLDFRASWDFGDGTIRARDLYTQIRGLPWVGTLRVGHFKEPYTLERLTSSRHIMFMERALMNTFATNRNMGLQLTNVLLGDRMTWAAGVFIETDETGFAFSDDPNHHITARVTGLAFTRDEGSRYLHLGLNYVHRFVGESISFESTPESRLSPVEYVSTGPFSARHVDQITPELALVWGRSRCRASTPWRWSMLQTSAILASTASTPRPAGS